MISQKCSTCNNKFLEKTSDYHKRTRNIFNPDSPLCNCCKRISKALTLPENVQNTLKKIARVKPKRVRKKAGVLEYTSIAYLQRKLKLSFKEAEMMSKNLAENAT